MASPLIRPVTGSSLNAMVMQLALADDVLAVSRLKDFSDEIGDTRKERQTFREQQIASAAEAAEKAKNIDGWSIFMKFVGFFAGSASIVAGSVLLATGAGSAAGVALIVTGALTLSSQICIESGVTRFIAERASGGNAHKAAKLLSQIDLGLNISTTVLALGAALINVSQIVSVAGKVITGTLQAAQSGLQGIGAIGSGVAQKEHMDVAAKSGYLSAKVEMSDRRVKAAKLSATEQADKGEISLAYTYQHSIEKRIQDTFKNHAAAAA